MRLGSRHKGREDCQSWRDYLEFATLITKGLVHVNRVSRISAYLCIAGAAASVASLGGCVVAAVGGAAAGGYTLATEERSPKQLAQDAAIAAVAHKYWSDQNVELARDLDATVYDGRLLITGIVPNADWKAEGERLARKVDNVSEVFNEVEVGQPTSFGQDARDGVVSNTLRAQMLGDTEVRSSNFTVHTLNGTVYILGFARNEAERDRVVGYARNLANVRRVVSYIRVGEAAAATPPAPASGSNSNAPAASPPVAAPTPRDAIEVTPLQ